MKSYDKKMQKKIFRQTVTKEVLKNAEIYDLAVLWTLHEVFGFGKKRLRLFYRLWVKIYRATKKAYFCEGDEEKFGSRTDAYVIKKRLKEIGFDYDAETEQMAEGGEAE